MSLPANNVMLQNVRLSFPDLFEPKQFEGKGASKFGAQFLIVPGSENDKAIRAAILLVATAKWPKTAAKMLKEFEPDKKAYPYIDGDRREYDGYAGMWALSAKRDEKNGAPAIVGRQREPLAAASGKPYAGCYVNARVEFWAQDKPNPGIRCALIAVQFWRDGEAFASGARPSADGFEAGDDLGDTGEALA